MPLTAPVRLPATPNAAALERYALMPVNEAAGTPSISVPIYEVHSGSLTMPLTLSYHASGIRVSDQASWSGVGWALNAGGVITRQVRGLPDERPGGFNYTYQKVPQRDTITIIKDQSLLEDIVTNRLVDYQPDLYNYNFQGQAGSFMRGNDGDFHCLPLQPVRIQQVDSAFLLADAHGITYLFDHLERSHSTGRPPASIPYISAWYLSRVVSADKADTIRLEYNASFLTSTSLQQQQVISFETGHNGKPASPSPPSETYSETLTTTYQTTWRLRQLIFRAGQVHFTTASRQDLPTDRRLTDVTVLATSQDTLKRIHLYQSYYGQEPRLRLDSLATTAPHLALPPTRFTYNVIPLPERLSGSRDHWGYYNGAARINSPKYLSPYALLVPRIAVTRVTGPSIYLGANRSPNPAY